MLQAKLSELLKVWVHNRDCHLGIYTECTQGEGAILKTTDKSNLYLCPKPLFSVRASAAKCYPTEKPNLAPQIRFCFAF